MQYQKNFYQIKSNETIFGYLQDEIDKVGYYNLVYQDTTHIKEFAQTVKQKHIVVIGIGGSTLGTYAIYSFLKKSNKYPKQLYFFESTDPVDISDRIDRLDLNDTFFVIISKSGTTIETISLFKYFQTLIAIDKINSVIISEEDSLLTKYANKHDIKTFNIDKNVGGRFSVFSTVGLVPLAIIGIDIDALLDGARDVKEDFFAQKEYYYNIMQKARFLVENKNRFNINVIFSYSSLLEGFNKWYIQLWGESLGKANINQTRQALTPIGLIGPVDQHSFLQLIVDGKRDKTITFIKISNFENKIFIPHKSLDGFDDLDYVDGLSFSQLIEYQANATIESIANLGDIPYDVITIDKVDEYSIASLMMSYQLLTSAIGRFVQIDTYNQPGVEAGKKILKEKLSKD